MINHSKNNQSLIICLLKIMLGVALVITVTSLPVTVHSENLEFHGFISQGLIFTSNNQVNGDSESGSLKLTEAGINVSKKFSPRLRFSSQIISRVTNSERDGDIRLDYAFFDYKIPFEGANQVGGRLGRVKNVIGFYNETRDVAFTRPSIFAPESIYFDSYRDLQLSNDGAIIYGNLFTDLGGFLLEAGYGQPRMDGKAETNLLGSNFDGKFDNHEVVQSRLTYTSPQQRWRFAYSWVDADLDYQSGVTTPFQEGIIMLNLSVLSGEFSGESFAITGETMELDVDYQLSPVLTQLVPIRSWYIQFQEYLTQDWTLYARYENYIPDDNDPEGSILNQVTGLPAHMAYSKTAIVGAKWQLSKDWLLMMEIENIKGTARLDSELNPDPFATKKNWQKVNLMLSWRF
ncbi:hypothetical protein [Aliikangiella sp. G2MR2-5]|uniref:hypothetical protein n=1 Tax=Aliikangiella sp. G2MR2-5 TaxID=2788943 RepID=UPI0018ABD67C|nr:hypothetical protein [Aliikangiella sp. G2MR2-5]